MRIEALNDDKRLKMKNDPVDEYTEIVNLLIHSNFRCFLVRLCHNDFQMSHSWEGPVQETRKLAIASLL